MELGSCFRTAAEQFLDMKSVTDYVFEFYSWNLVHGAVIGTFGPAEGVKFVHAWLESPHLCLVWDTMDKLAPIPEYYQVGQVTDTVIYHSRQEVRKLMIQHGDYGPWDDTLRAVEVPDEVIDRFLRTPKEEIFKDGSI